MKYIVTIQLSKAFNDGRTLIRYDFRSRKTFQDFLRLCRQYGIQVVEALEGNTRIKLKS